MPTVKHGAWTIEVDLDKTERYYRELTVSDDSQVYRNFERYCDSMPDDERAFFDSFGVPPKLCRIGEPVGRSRDMTVPTDGHFFVYGRYISTPEEILMTPEELIEADFEPDVPDPRIEIGMFQFDFQKPGNVFCDIPDDMPDGCICVNFWCEELPWLLEEKCRLDLIDPPRFWEIGRIIAQHRKNRRARCEYLKELRHDIENAFAAAGISYEPMKQGEVSSYKKAWLNAFAPESADMKELRRLCFGERWACGFLWHLFSFEHVKVPAPEESQRLFDTIPKDAAVLIVNTDDIGYRVENLARLTSGMLSSISDWFDVTVTASDFSWTYSKTHESDCGPYFYRK